MIQNEGFTVSLFVLTIKSSSYWSIFVVRHRIVKYNE